MTINSHLLRRFLITTLFSVVLVISLAWLLLRGSLPHYEGSANLTGLSAPVTVERDQLGSVTIIAKNRLDIARSIGFIHAQERFFEMDLMRRQAAGELSELFGSATLTNDLETRKYRMRKRAKLAFSRLPQEQQQQLDIYRDGVNEGLDALKVRPYPYLLTQTKPTAWQSEDSILVILAMFRILNESSIYRELGLSAMRSALPANVYQFLNSSGGPWDAPLIGEALDWPLLPSAEEINVRGLDADLFQKDYNYEGNMPGSNNFAVSGSLTKGGALVANDMHLTLRVPNLWFRTRFLYPSDSGADNDITGISLPGVPIIVLGSNRHIAWSFTNSYGDFADWVRITLDPNDKQRYLGTSGWQSIEESKEIIKVKNAPDEILTVRETKWGPIITSDHDNVPLALKWTALHDDAINLNLIQLEHTKTTHDAVNIAQQSGIPVQNFVVGDRAGNISWTIAGRIPKRTNNFDPQLPSDWSKSDVGWRGWLAPQHYPLIYNPDSQRLWTANTRTVNDPYLILLGDGGYDLGARATQIRDNLFLKNTFTVNDLYSIQLDHRALFLSRWYDLLNQHINQAEDTPIILELKQSLANWTGEATANSVAYRIVRKYRYQVTSTILSAFTAKIRSVHPSFSLPRLNQAEHAVWQIIQAQPHHLLPPEFGNWEELLLSCAIQVAEQLNAQPGGITARQWGEKNQAQIKHPLSQNLPTFIANWLDMPPNPLPGDSNMPRIQSPNFGASQRSVVTPGKEEEGIFDMPGGQSGHLLSPYYGSGHDHWVSENPTSFLPGPADKILTLIPADKVSLN